MEPTVPLVIDGPVVEAPGHEIIYQVTLSSGTVITGPNGFGPEPIQMPLAPRSPLAQMGLVQEGQVRVGAVQCLDP